MIEIYFTHRKKVPYYTRDTLHLSRNLQLLRDECKFDFRFSLHRLCQFTLSNKHREMYCETHRSRQVMIVAH